jgi:hypothetical protein
MGKSRQKCWIGRKRFAARVLGWWIKSSGASLIAYNLVPRLEMEQVAKEAGVEPTRISFVAALHLIVDEWLWAALTSPGAIPSRLRDLRAHLKSFILPPRRSTRSYPRAVKIKMSNYARKRPSPTRNR